MIGNDGLESSCIIQSNIYYCFFQRVFKARLVEDTVCDLSSFPEHFR